MNQPAPSAFLLEKYLNDQCTDREKELVERRVELGCEWTDRLADLKRWGDYDKINAPLHGRNHTNKTDPASPFIVEQVWPARKFTAAKLAWPISPNEIARSNGAYKQTPGW